MNEFWAGMLPLIAADEWFARWSTRPWQQRLRPSGVGPRDIDGLAIHALSEIDGLVPAAHRQLSATAPCSRLKPERSATYRSRPLPIGSAHARRRATDRPTDHRFLNPPRARPVARLEEARMVRVPAKDASVRGRSGSARRAT